MNYSTEPMSSTMSPYLSGTSSPIPGGPNNYNSKQSQMPTTSMGMAAAVAAAAASSSSGNGKGSGYSSPALAYANAQLSQYAQHQSPGQLQQQQQQAQQQPRQMNGNLFSPQVPGAQYANFFAQGTALPAHLNPHALSAALADYNSNSIPDSAASSPGQQYKRLTGSSSASGFASGTATGASTPGGNSRVAASAITGKRLNWSEMICQTIAESDTGKLVIQDLFEGMCNKFPEIREWAFGKDWEGRVKNRIKSTLSIKGNLFIKIPRPSSASGKGSWWTLSQEAQDAWKEGRVASVVKSGTHSQSLSLSRGIDSMTSLSAATSRAGSRAPSRRGSPASSRGPSSQHANQHSHSNSRGTPHQSYVNFNQDNYYSSSPSSNYNSNRQSPSANLPVGLGMSPINFGSSSFEGLSMSSLTGMDEVDEPNVEPSARRMRMMENSVNDSFDSTVSSGPSTSIPMSSAMNLAMTSMAGAGSNMYDMSPFNSFNPNAAQQLGPLQSAAHLGGPQSMPFPASSTSLTSIPANGGYDDKQQQQTNSFISNNQNNSTKTDFDPSLLGETSFAQFGGIDLSNMEGMNGMHNPFGSMAGGYTMLSEGNGGPGGAQPTPIPGRNNSGQMTNSGDSLRPSSSSFSANFIGGPSPADSTGSSSAFFAYTPAMMAADAAMGNTHGSALGPIGGEGSKKKKEGLTDLQLPPSAQSSDSYNSGHYSSNQHSNRQ